VIEEQRSRRHISIATLSGWASFGRLLCCPSFRDCYRYSRSSLGASSQNAHPRFYRSHGLGAMACIWAVFLAVLCSNARAQEKISTGVRPFRFPADTLAFSNETYFEYRSTPQGEISIHRRPKGTEPDYSRYCFVMARAVMQFYKFAEFRPDLPKASDSEYRELIQRLSRIPAWSSGPSSKIIIPGYKDLYSFSLEHRQVLQKNLGKWWPPYWRIGNWRIVFPMPRSSQQHIAFWLKNELDAASVRAIYMTRFKALNHCLIAYSYTTTPDGDLVFNVYDVNQPAKVVHVRYHAADRSFYLDKTWYYNGGLVSILKLYVSALL
jgi:hypothetical protein